MRFSNIQNRMSEHSMTKNGEVVFRNEIYQLGKTLPPTLQTANGTIALLGDGYQIQFELKQNDVVVGEAWFYCYLSQELKFWAVLDEVELYDKEDLK